jgi:hypothetical protein
MTTGKYKKNRIGEKEKGELSRIDKRRFLSQCFPLTFKDWKEVS